jgi:hypothetical protein
MDGKRVYKRNMPVFMKIAATIFSVVLLCAFGACSFLKQGDRMTSDDFVYGYIAKSGASRRAKEGDYVAVLELTDTAKQKKTIIVPDYIDDKPVVQIGMEGIGFSIGLLSYGSNFDKLYLPKNIISINLSQCIYSSIKVFFLALSDFDFLKNYGGTFYLEEQLYKEFIISGTTSSTNGSVLLANITYISENKVYLVDNYDDGDSLSAPVQPTREMYTFSGWYKEPELITEWDFENEVFERDETVSTMKLYAKWS